jgi:hypothetical protein
MAKRNLVHKMTEGDGGPPLHVTLYDGDTPVDFANVTTVEFNLRRKSGDKALVIDHGPADPQAEGVVEFNAWPIAQMKKGVYEGELELLFDGDTDPLTWPSDGKIIVIVRPQVA